MTKSSTLKFYINAYLSEIESVSVNSATKEEKSDRGEVEVSDRCLKNILDYARAYRVVNTQQIGNVELMMN